MRLEHYTEEVFKFERRSYEQHEPRGFLKPVGLWVSVAGEDDWPAWCRAEEFCLSSLEHLSVVTLVDDANVLLIDTAVKLDEFHEKYAVDDDLLHTGKASRRPWARDEKKYWAMDWRAVAAEYDGIIMAPYLWSRRLDGPMWYYGIDAASGCIWNLDAIAEVKVIR